MAISSNATGLRPGVCTSTTRPTTPYTGMLIYETDTGYLRVWDGSAWDYLSQSQDTTQGLPAGDKMGLVHIKTATVTNATDSGTTWQSVFTSAYDSYLFVCHTASSDINTSACMVSFYYNTNTEQATGYRYGLIGRHPVGFTSTSNSQSATGVQVIQDMGNANLTSNCFSMNIFGAGSSNRLMVTFQSMNVGYQPYSGSGSVDTARTYDGMKFFALGGVGAKITITGSLYGYRKA